MSDTTLDGDSYGQVILANCTDVCVRDGSIYNSSIGILVGYCTNCTLENNTLYNHAQYGAYLRHSNNCTLVNNTIYSSYDGIFAYYSENSTIFNNTLHSMIYYGIGVSQSDFANISNNTLRYNKEYGVYIYSSDNNTVTHNRFHDNFLFGLECHSIDNTDVIGNEFLNNVVGIDFDSGSENNSIYDNIIAWNTQYNARDNGYYNDWDDGISIGNIWSAYDGVGPYTVPGSAGAIDHYPRQVDSDDPVFISTPDDVEYGEGTLGPTLTWDVFDDNPVSYTVFINGSEASPSNFADNGVWNTSTISISLATDFSFDLGLRNLTLVLVDGCFNTAVDSVWISVLDVTPPIIEDIDDIEEDDNTNFQIIWNATDAHPTTYRVLRDGSEIQTGTYAIHYLIIVDCDDLSVGTYNYTCIVYDVGDNWAADTVIVTIIPAETETTTTTTGIDTDTGTSPTDINPQLIMMIVIVGSICVVIIVVVLITKRRR